ncbi:phage holin family protein [Methylonatrum kenyense]|uniref:phage holin family protein n=1 Tax=Methylonatrum kenyense TaxID=455253 RepID=UPI0020BE4814|nr:phage holin family protein [Methylonatrum kenyense]MCK8516896.1 phage holin family protein [Methylonatrum kenyense]
MQDEREARVEAEPKGGATPTQGDALIDLGRTVAGVLRDSAELFATDARLALRSALLLLVCALILAILAVSVWLYLSAALALAAAELAGWSLWLAALLAAGVNLLAAGGLALWARSMLRDLGFRESRAALAEALGRQAEDRNNG